MDSIIIRGNGALNGTIPISGAKNAALPLMIASLLTSEPLVLENLPRLADVEALKDILSNHGVDYRVDPLNDRERCSQVFPPACNPVRGPLSPLP